MINATINATMRVPRNRRPTLCRLCGLAVSSRALSRGDYCLDGATGSPVHVDCQRDEVLWGRTRRG